MGVILILGVLLALTAVGIVSFLTGKAKREEEIVAHRLDDAIGFEEWITKKSHALAKQRWMMFDPDRKQPLLANTTARMLKETDRAKYNQIVELLRSRNFSPSTIAKITKVSVHTVVCVLRIEELALAAGVLIDKSQVFQPKKQQGEAADY